MEEQGRVEPAFLEWAAELGISDSGDVSTGNSNSCLGHSLSVSYFPDAGGRGLAAVRDIRKGEVILRVPKSALMTRDSLLRDEKLFAAVRNHPYLSSTQILSACLLAELGKKKSSKWYPYLKHLPRSYETLSTFGEFEMQALQVDDAIWAAQKAVSNGRSNWKEAALLLEEIELMPQLQTLRAWLWASSTITSRTLHIPWDDAGCLCPVGDLFNYAAPGDELDESDCLRSCTKIPSLQVISKDEKCSDEFGLEQSDLHSQNLTDGGYEDAAAAYCFYARRNYKKGEQVLLCYGTYTNLELLEHYGFLLKDNPNDKAFIPLEPSMYPTTCSWLKDSLCIFQSGEPSFLLLCTLRSWAISPHQRRSMGHFVYSGLQLSAENEIIVLTWILEKCRHVLEKLTTSVEEDCLLLPMIDRLDDPKSLVGLKMVKSTISDEICAFLEANGMQNREYGAEFSNKFKRSIDKWKLAVQWRLRYKRIHIDCMSYCSNIIKSLHQNSSAIRTKVKPDLA